jgi:protein-tyrosine phosphatase
MDTVVTTGRVIYDKSCDYLRYYFSYENNDNLDEIKEEKIIDIDEINKLLNLEEKNEDNESMRIFPEVSFFDEWSTFFTEPTHIIDNIYLGSAFNATSSETLRTKDIKIIINVTREISNWNENDENMKYINCPIYDNNSDSIKHKLDELYNTIVEYQKETEGNILIHCLMGRSRSASVMIYYMMKKYDKSLAEAIEFVKYMRPVVNPTYKLIDDLMSIE